MRLNRRDLLAAAAVAPAAAWLGAAVPIAARAQGATGSELVLLGTKGGPRVGGNRANPATLIRVDGTPYLVDCGYGCARQLVSAGVRLENLHHIFFTHLHSDHMLDYGSVFYSAWATGLKEPIDVYGMPPLDEMTAAFLQAFKFDIDTRIADEGRPDLRKLVRPHEFSEPGVIFENAQVKVTAARVRHPPIHDAFALRLDMADKSIVVSGDTAYSPELIELAQGADILVHEVMYLPGIDALARRVANGATLKEHLLASHTTTEEVGKVAAAAGVGKLVLTHFVPGDDPSISDEMWAEGVRQQYRGELVIGKDLMVVR